MNMLGRSAVAGRALVALIVGSGLLAAPPTVAADQSSNIPGIPLPAPVVSGQLGGPIFDVVYRLDVPAGYVIVAGLGGTTGTDFDLFLFDSSATSVGSNIGLLASSTGPASSEQLSWPTRLGGIFYLDLFGASDVQGTYTLSVQIVLDPTPPTARLIVANGISLVNSLQITLQLITFDDLSGVTEMSLSADGINYLPAVPIQSQFSWILSEGDGPKRVWVRVTNGTGLISAPASVLVTLDTTGPLVTDSEPVPNTAVTVARPLISVTFDEPVVATTWSNLGLVMQAATGGIVPGEYAYYPTTLTGTFTPSADLVPGLVYILTVGDVRDPAGNRVRDAGSWALKRLLPTAVSLTANRTVVVVGEAVDLKGTASVPVGDSVVLEVKPGGVADFTTERTFLPVNGAFGLSFVSSGNVTYRASYPSTPTTIGSASKDVRILVRRKVVLLGPGPATTRTVTAGKPVILTTQVTPAGVASVSFRLYRFDAALGGYRYAGSFGRKTDASGRATMSWTPSAGRFYWRVAVLPSPTFANNTTSAYRWTVR
jgi:hypothetical protein